MTDKCPTCREIEAQRLIRLADKAKLNRGHQRGWQRRFQHETARVIRRDLGMPV